MTTLTTTCPKCQEPIKVHVDLSCGPPAEVGVECACGAIPVWSLSWWYEIDLGDLLRDENQQTEDAA